MDKKILAIIILSLIIIGLLIWIFGPGRGSTEAALESLRNERIEFIRSTALIESANSEIRAESEKLREDNLQSEKDNTKLESENNEYRNIIEQLTAGSDETKAYLSEYGEINRDFAGFIRQNRTTE